MSEQAAKDALEAKDWEVKLQRRIGGTELLEGPEEGAGEGDAEAELDPSQLKSESRAHLKLVLLLFLFLSIMFLFCDVAC
jgi:hypothetical protein